MERGESPEDLCWEARGCIRLLFLLPILTSNFPRRAATACGEEKFLFPLAASRAAFGARVTAERALPGGRAERSRITCGNLFLIANVTQRVAIRNKKSKKIMNTSGAPNQKMAATLCECSRRVPRQKGGDVRPACRREKPLSARQRKKGFLLCVDAAATEHARAFCQTVHRTACTGIKQR